MKTSWRAIERMRIEHPGPFRKKSPKKKSKKKVAKKNDERHKFKVVMRQRAERMRSNPTPAEKHLRGLLVDAKLNCGFSFRCQEPKLGAYILDFACNKVKLYVEVDGGYHLTPEQKRKDSVRTWRLAKIGWKVVRFTNERVLTDGSSVMQEIVTACRERRVKK